MTPLRVAFLTDRLSSLAGTEASIVATCEMLRSAGDEVLVCCSCAEEGVHQYWKGLLQKAGARLIEQLPEGRPGGMSTRAFCEVIAGVLHTWKPHLIHAIPLAPLGLTWATSGLLPEVPKIATETSAASPRCFWYDPSSFEDFFHYDAIIATCERVRTGIRDYFGYRGRVVVIPSVVPVPAKERTPLTAEDLMRVNSLGAISRLRVEKGTEFMIAALALIAPAVPEVTLTIYGETPELERTLQVAQALGVADRLSLPGPFEGASEIDRVIRSHCIFLLPSMFEGLPLSLLEVLARGRIIVASDVGCISEIFDSTSAGIVVAPGNPQAISEAVVALLADVPGLVKRSEAGIRRFNERYHADIVFPALRNLYIEIVRTAGRGRS